MRAPSFRTSFDPFIPKNSTDGLLRWSNPFLLLITMNSIFALRNFAKQIKSSASWINIMTILFLFAIFISAAPCSGRVAFLTSIFPSRSPFSCLSNRCASSFGRWHLYGNTKKQARTLHALQSTLCSDDIVTKATYPPAERIIAIGDVHGDIVALRSCLTIAGLIDKDNKWTGGETHLVQVREEQTQSLCPPLRDLPDA